MVLSWIAALRSFTSFSGSEFTIDFLDLDARGLLIPTLMDTLSGIKWFVQNAIEFCILAVPSRASEFALDGHSQIVLGGVTEFLLAVNKPSIKDESAGCVLHPTAWLNADDGAGYRALGPRAPPPRYRCT